MGDRSWKDEHADMVMGGMQSEAQKRFCLWPVRRIHHAYGGYGYATVPIRGWSLCWFSSTGFERAHRNVFHDCTKTGVY